MEFTVQRKPTFLDTTLGELLREDGSRICYTLEDPVRDLKTDGSGKVYGKTAIPAGRYRIIIDFSQKFQKDMVHVLDVPFFTGIRIHSLNTAEDTLGCIGVGYVIESPTRISGGSSAMPALFTIIRAALDSGQEVWLTVKDPQR